MPLDDRISGHKELQALQKSPVKINSSFGPAEEIAEDHNK